MARKHFNLEDVLNYVETLPYTQFKKVVEHYSQKQSSDFSSTLNQLVVSNFEQRLERLEVNTTCPSCTSNATEEYSGYSLSGIGQRKGVFD